MVFFDCLSSRPFLVEKSEFTDETRDSQERGQNLEIGNLNEALDILRGYIQDPRVGLVLDRKSVV